MDAMSTDRPFFKSAVRHGMAIKALDLADWLAFGEDFAHQMAERRRLLDERSKDVLAHLPGSEAGQAELLTLLLDHLEHHAGDRYRVQADAVVELASGFRHLRSGTSPLDLAGRLVQEDFCILEKRDGRYRLVAAVVCFPGHWSLAEKIGKPLLDIHAPVPAFAEQLGAPVERLFEKLEPMRPVQRLNWSIVDTDVLFLHPSQKRDPVALSADRIGEQLRLRIERQTLRRLPATGAVVFGIRTHVAPMSRAIDSAEAAEAMIQRLHELPGPMLAYKSLADLKPAFLRYLKRRRATLS